MPGNYIKRGGMARRMRRTDLGLAVSGALLQPGCCRTLVEIAAFAGVSKQAIEQIEKRALQKVREHLKLHGELARELREQSVR